MGGMSTRAKAEARRKLQAGEPLTGLEASYLYGLTAGFAPLKQRIAKQRIAELAGTRKRQAAEGGKLEGKPPGAGGPTPPPVELTLEPDTVFDTCLTCGYADGFKLALERPGAGGAQLILICPRCHQRYTVGLIITPEKGTTPP